MKHIRLPVALLLLPILAAGCSSTYHTNTDLTFQSVKLGDRKPEITVGKIEQTPDQLTFLGWIDAEVTKPNILDADPTEKMADMVLAHIGSQLGADAVIHVTYKVGGNLSPLTRIQARGQAVIINDLHDGSPRQPLYTGAAITESIARKKPEKIKRAPQILQDEPVAEPEPVHIENREPDEDSVLANYRELIKRDTSADRRERIDLMLNNARFLKQKSEEYNDKAMYNASLRLIQLLESLRKQFEAP